ncbi:uncharacterized protein [Periplaneta americana]|uniref:uncharacterized protein n=1 Tax=Periplaneta americana TaxID=6978 RepID=UPI0037E986A2
MTADVTGLSIFGPEIRNLKNELIGLQQDSELEANNVTTRQTRMRSTVEGRLRVSLPLRHLSVSSGRARDSCVRVISTDTWTHGLLKEVMSGVRYLEDDDAYRNGSSTELMVYGDLYSSTSWPRHNHHHHHHHADHVQAILNMSEAYLHAAASYQDERVAYSDRWANSWSAQQKKSAGSGGKTRTRRTYSADRYRQQQAVLHHEPVARRYSAGAEWRRRGVVDTSETEDEEDVANLDLNEHLTRCQCSCDHLGYTRSAQRPQQLRTREADDNDNSTLYSPEIARAPSKPEVTFYPQGSSTPSSTSVASGLLTHCPLARAQSREIRGAVLWDAVAALRASCFNFTTRRSQQQHRHLIQLTIPFHSLYRHMLPRVIGDGCRTSP